LLQQIISNDDFNELRAEELLEPRGPRRNDLGHAITASTIANVNRAKKTSKTYKYADFLPSFDEPEQEQKRVMTDADLAAVARALNKAFGGEEKQRG
jgi:hypothetical protein